MTGNGSKPPGGPGRGLENVQRDGRPVAGAEPGNTRSLTHGASSEQRLGPLREYHAAAVRRDYPHLDERRLAILADRLARMDSARGWLDRQDGVVRNRHGQVWPVLVELEKWAKVAEQRLAEAEARAPVPVEERLRAHLEERP